MNRIYEDVRHMKVIHLTIQKSSKRSSLCVCPIPHIKVTLLFIFILLCGHQARHHNASSPKEAVFCSEQIRFPSQ